MGSILDRLVARAIPADIEDPAQEGIAAEAAENALRPVLTAAGIAGVAVVAALAVLLYTFWPSAKSGDGAALSAPAGPFGSDVAYAKLLQAKEEVDGKLQQVKTERDALQGKVAELERRLEELTKPQPQAAGAAPAAQEPTKQDALQRKVGELERHVADLTQQLQATRAAAVVDRGARTPKPAKPSGTQVSAEPRLAYRCGDGRTVRDPATCKATGSASPEVGASVTDTYYCGDGRSVPNPAECRPAGAPPPRG